MISHDGTLIRELIDTKIRLVSSVPVVVNAKRFKELQKKGYS